MILLFGLLGFGKIILLLVFVGKFDKDLKVSIYFEFLFLNFVKLLFFWIVVKINVGNIRRLKYDLVIV